MDSLKKAMPVRVQITAILRKALFSGEYKSGDELSLTETAERLGVSRTPVREAFQTLEAEGLIELRMNRGAIVKTIDEKYITDHYEMRILLESEAAKRAAQRGMPDAADYIKKLEALQSHMDSVSTEEYEELHLAVHSAIWTTSGSTNSCPVSGTAPAWALPPRSWTIISSPLRSILTSSRPSRSRMPGPPRRKWQSTSSAA